MWIGLANLPPTNLGTKKAPSKGAADFSEERQAISSNFKFCQVKPSSPSSKIK